MKDCEGPSTNDDNHQRLSASVGDSHSSNGGFGLSNGCTVNKVVSRRRAASGGGCRCSDVNGSFCQLPLNGHLTAPRVEQPPALPVAEPVDNGFVPTGHVGDGGGGWAVPTRVQILRDLANLCTFTGAILATLAMACMWKGRYEIPMITLFTSYWVRALVQW